MTKISKRYLNKNLEEHIFKLFIKTIAEVKDENDVKNFIEDLLSPTEKTMLTKRLAIAILLTKGYTYDDIDNILKVSRSTIMNVSFWLKNGKNGYEKAVEKIILNQEKEKLFDKIEEMLIKLSPPKLYGSAAFEKKQKQGRNLFQRRVRRSLI